MCYISLDGPHLLVSERGALAKSLVELLPMVGCPRPHKDPTMQFLIFMAFPLSDCHIIIPNLLC
jgi:hypothetical protein